MRFIIYNICITIAIFVGYFFLNIEGPKKTAIYCSCLVLMSLEGYTDGLTRRP